MSLLGTSDQQWHQKMTCREFPSRHFFQKEQFQGRSYAWELAPNEIADHSAMKRFEIHVYNMGEETIGKAVLREELAKFVACWPQLKGADAVTLQLTDDACSDN